MQHETATRLADQRHDRIPTDRAVAPQVGETALRNHPELTPQNFYAIAGKGAGEHRSLISHPIPTRDQEIILFSHPPNLVESQRPRTTIRIRTLLNDEEFLRSISNRKSIPQTS